MKVKKNKRPGIAVYQFPYYKSERGFLRIFLTKLLFACALAFSGAGLFAVLLEMDIDPVTPAIAATLVCGVGFVLLGFFRKLYVAIFAVVVFMFIFSDTPLFLTGQDLLYQIFSVSDGNIIRTAGILTQSEIRDPMPFFMFLIYIYGALCAFSSCQRFRPLAVMTFAEIMMIPAFLGQSLHFSNWLAVFIAALLGMWAVTVAAAADAAISSGYSSNLHMSDYVYLKANKRLSPAEKLCSDSLHFGKHLSHSITVFIVTLLTLGITASTFPSDGSLRLEDIASGAMDITQNIGYWFNDLFGYSGFSGFFSADGGDINISGSIDPEDHPTGNRPVAEIITENKDKMYLKGDIGYTFKGDKWESIAGLNYGGIHYGDSPSVKYILDNYAPEVQFYLTRYSLTRTLSDGFYYIKNQSVKVNYLQDINTLLIPGTPYVFNFRDNTNFSIYGDFVAIADKGRVNSMKTAVLYSNESGNYLSTIMSFRDLHDDTNSIREEWDALPMPMTYENYTYYINIYRDFVYDYYTDVPEEEIKNIEGFLSESFNDYQLPPIYAEDRLYGSLDESDMYTRSIFAENICAYLSSSRAFRYSLNTDNSAGSNTFLGNFLNETRAGHCALYATTMCLALRYLGVPARYVTGFTIGGDECEKTSEGYSYTVLEKDLHAWVEVYYDNVGWIPYDPTPPRGGNTGTGTAPIETTLPRTTPPTMNTPDVTTTTRPPETTTTTEPVDPSVSLGGGEGPEGSKPLDPEVIKAILIIAGIIALALVIALSIAGALKTLRRKERQLIGFFRKGDAAKAVGDMFTFTLKMLDMSKVQRRSGETPTEFARRADKTLRAGLGIGLEQAMPLFERAEFDPEPTFDEDERQIVYSAVSKLYSELMLNTKGLNRIITRIKLFGKVKIDRKEK